MLLRNIILSGFKSFRRRTELPISDRTTVLIGPNDHGKTNALAAADRLNIDRKFDVPDLNDRCESKDDAYLSYTLTVNAAEVKTLSDLVTASEVIGNALGGDSSASVQKDEDGAPVRVTEIDAWLDSLRKSRKLEVIRPYGQDLKARLDQLPEKWRPSLSAVIPKALPKVILFTAETLRQLPDTVDATALQANEVMQGVFRLAGIWDQRLDLLSGNTRQNQDTLRDASELLTARIRLNWTQGRDLKFFLEYVGNNIRLTVKDTARTVTAVGERSEGFTSYFAMRMLLLARTEAAQPNGYIFMFDEPGLNLHPKGQVDLQNVFENIAATNQIIYSTHSVFLINKNYPDRNHLVFKNQEGSNIDNKPFVGGWAKVKEHLGLYLSSNFLFSDKVLLTEGTSDEIYLPLIIQGLIEKNKFNGDLNAFAVNSSLNDPETIAAANMYVKEDRRVAVLVDGDDAGSRRKARIEKWSQQTNRKCPVISLSEIKPDPCSIEDFLEPSTFKDAVVLACKEAIDLGVLKPKRATWEHDIRSGLNAKEGKSLGRRVEELVVEAFGEPISDNWIARKYAECLRSPEQESRDAIEAYWSEEALTTLVTTIWRHLELPTRGDLTKVPFTTDE